MAKNKIITLEMASEFSGLTEQAGDNYFRARLQTLPVLKKEVIDPVERAVRKRTGWSDDNIPSKQQEKEVRVGKTTFHVTTTPTLKRPGYKEVYEHTLHLLHTLERQQEQGMTGKGIVMRDDTMFVSLPYIMGEVGDYKESVLSKGVKQEITVGLQTPRDKIVVPLIGYSRLPKQAGEIYTRAKPFHKQANERAVTSLENALYDETGFDDKNIPKDAEDHWTQLGKYLFHVISTPSETVKYGQIVNGLLKETKKPGKTTGDLHRIVQGWDLPPGVTLDVYEHAGKQFVSMDSLKQRIVDMTAENTTEKTSRSMTHYPLSWE